MSEPSRGTATPLDEAYAERANVVALAVEMARRLGFQVGALNDAAEPEWPVVFIGLPTGQVSWHFSRADFERLFPDGLPPFPAAWDGHDTATKYARCERLSAVQAAVSEARSVVAADITIRGERASLPTESSEPTAVPTGELLPCPFCELPGQMSGSRREVGCSDCNAEVRGGTPAEAIAAWNRRAPECGQREPEPAGERVSEEEWERERLLDELEVLVRTSATGWVVWSLYPQEAAYLLSLLRTSSARPADLEALIEATVPAIRDIGSLSPHTPTDDAIRSVLRTFARHLAPTSDR